MSRSTPEDLAKLTDSSLSSVLLQNFIDVASAVIDEVESDGLVVSATASTSAESYLAAHIMLSTSMGQSGGGLTVSQYSVQGITSKYDIATIAGEGFTSTRYGQIANMLLKGALVEQSEKRASVGFA